MQRWYKCLVLENIFFNKNKIARRFSFSYVFAGFIGLLFLDKLVQIFFEHNDVSKNGIFTFGLLFIISTGILLYFMINHMQKVIRNIEKAYNDLKQKEKDRLAPYEFALDHSVDAIHWFTLEGKFTYVNEATCKLDGYTKEEFENMY